MSHCARITHPAAFLSKTDMRAKDRVDAFNMALTHNCALTPRFWMYTRYAQKFSVSSRRLLQLLDGRSRRSGYRWKACEKSQQEIASKFNDFDNNIANDPIEIISFP
jgi:hypothetical protein